MLSCQSDVFFSGQNIITFVFVILNAQFLLLESWKHSSFLMHNGFWGPYRQGMMEDTFFVIRRGKADIMIDGAVVGSVGQGVPLGELALMYGARCGTPSVTDSKCHS